MDLNHVLKTTRYILHHHGAFNQVPKTIEECSELILELSKHFNYSDNQDEIVDEIADVIIMSLQMAHLFGFEYVKRRIEYKLAREVKRISLAKPKQYAKNPDDVLEDNICFGE